MVTVMGEALVDVVRRAGAAPRALPGGSPLNVAVGLSRLGHRTQFISRCGSDEHGRLLLEHLHSAGVEIPWEPDQAPTSTAEARIGAEGAAAYEFHLDWNLEAAREALREVLPQTTVLHVGSIATMLEPGAQTVLEAVRAVQDHALVSYDPNCRPSILPDRAAARSWAEALAARADLVKASDEDFQWLYPERTLAESAQAWRALGAGLVVVTAGGEGCRAFNAATGPEGLAVPVPEVEVADTVGAGDSLMAALLSALVDRGLDGPEAAQGLAELDAAPLTEVLAYAARAAAVTVSREGADPPTRIELEAGR